MEGEGGSSNVEVRYGLWVLISLPDRGNRGPGGIYWILLIVIPLRSM